MMSPPTSPNATHRKTSPAVFVSVFLFIVNLNCER